ncbi:MAG: hypothetical protein H0U60_14625 [Blastocatellia bacterium]|nr:hypothetical protein [Blastocatellia bacterium]
MVEITINNDRVVFEVEGWHKLWTLRSRLEIPLAHIKGAHADPEPAMSWFNGLKILGTDIPNVFKAGIFYQGDGFVFWDVLHPEKTIVIELDHEHFAKLILEVADPQVSVQMLNDAIARPLA